MKEQQPFIFWHSDPVRPDETLVLAGEDFAENAFVELAEAKGKWVAVKPVQRSRQCLKAVIPPEFRYGTWQCRVRQGGVVSKEISVNAPDVWWKQGDGGVDAAFPGSWLRLFGKCLNLPIHHALLAKKGVSLSGAGLFRSQSDRPGKRASRHVSAGGFQRQLLGRGGIAGDPGTETG